jgi:ankyrin repeat protein
MIAAGFESRDALLKLINTEPQLMVELTGLGETPLHYLTVENQVEAVRLLVEKGASVNTLNECGETPLSAAASLGYEELVGFLLESGAKLSLPGQREPTLHEATRGGNAVTVRRLLQARAHPNETNDLDETPLHIAAETDDRVEVLRVLLDAGADPALKRIFDETPLGVAINRNSSRCIEILVARNSKNGV